jgi:hypothetical protein
MEYIAGKRFAMSTMTGALMWVSLTHTAETQKGPRERAVHDIRVEHLGANCRQVFEREPVRQRYFRSNKAMCFQQQQVATGTALRRMDPQAAPFAL